LFSYTSICILSKKGITSRLIWGQGRSSMLYSQPGGTRPFRPPACAQQASGFHTNSIVRPSCGVPVLRNKRLSLLSAPLPSNCDQQQQSFYNRMTDSAVSSFRDAMRQSIAIAAIPSKRFSII